MHKATFYTKLPLLVLSESDWMLPQQYFAVKTFYLQLYPTYYLQPANSAQCVIGLLYLPKVFQKEY